jgi:hypothetical protein
LKELIVMHAHTYAGRLGVVAIVAIGATRIGSSSLAGQASGQGRATAVPAAKESKSGMSDVERLVAAEQIKQLKARYFRCLDTKDWACLEAVYAPDVRVTFLNSPDQKPESVQPVIGRANIIASQKRSVTPLLTVHHGHMPEIEITSPTTAIGIWAMEDLVEGRDGTNRMRGYGHYHETYERIDGQWMIKTLLLTRLRVDREKP